MHGTAGRFPCRCWGQVMGILAVRNEDEGSLRTGAYLGQALAALLGFWRSLSTTYASLCERAPCTARVVSTIGRLRGWLRKERERGGQGYHRDLSSTTQVARSWERTR